MEMAEHKKFTIATDVNVYFCDPQSPWQRGTNENTNRLLRQYFPKGTNLSGYSQSDLNKIALRLNQRPRKTLGFQRLQINSCSVAVSAYYFHSIPFNAKLSLFALIGLASIYPTRNFLSWRAALRQGTAPAVEPATLRALRAIIH